MQVLASQLHFLTNRNAELAIPPLFWPVNCIKIGGHVALLSDPTVYSLYCGLKWVSTDPGFSVYTSVYYKTSGTKTTIDLDKICEKKFPSLY